MNVVGIIFASIALVLQVIALILSVRMCIKAVRDIAKCEMECPEEAKEIDGNACVCCGANIPEGRQVCIDCERDDGTNT